MSIVDRAETAFESGELTIARWINVLALFGLIGVLAGSLFLQFGVGEQPCPLCLVQRSGMIAIAVGPIMNLLWGMRPMHYALSILGAMVGSAGSVRQILLHIEPGDPGYGPAVFGLHLYTWALVTFAIAIVGCAFMLLWTKTFEAGDTGVVDQRGFLRFAAFVGIAWVTIDLLIVGISVVPECGLGMRPDNPADIQGLGGVGGVLMTIAVGAVAVIVAAIADRRMSSKPSESV